MYYAATSFSTKAMAVLFVLRPSFSLVLSLHMLSPFARPLCALERRHPLPPSLVQDVKRPGMVQSSHDCRGIASVADTALKTNKQTSEFSRKAHREYMFMASGGMEDDHL